MVTALGSGGIARAELWINELLFNPAGDDAPLEDVELRGTPNLELPTTLSLVAIEGDAGGNPGTIQNLFDLSGHRLGGNGFLVLLQQDSPYLGLVAPAARVLINAGEEPGWGNGLAGTVGHQGENGQTDLENPSATFLLVQPPSR